MSDNEEQLAGQETALAAGVRDFTHDFYKSVAGKSKGNFVGSALSAHTVLAMVAYGADGSTAREMRKALRLPENDEQTHQEFQSFIGRFNNVPNVDLKIANKVCISHRITVKDRFREITGKYFHSEHTAFDFTRVAESVKSINEWCLDKTNGKIEDVIRESDINSMTALILLNAVYFKGNWKHKFNANATELKPFHLTKSTTIEVPTMHITKKFRYKEVPEFGAQCVRLPYVNEDLFMEIIVPREVDGLKQIELNLEKITQNDEDYNTMEIELALPKFKIETEIDLNLHLQEMGMKEMFTDAAQFGNMTDESVRVSKVKQKAFIEVNEEGSEAAAVTGVTLVHYSLMLPIRCQLDVDRPFAYRILARGVSLFSGRVINPLS